MPDSHENMSGENRTRGIWGRGQLRLLSLQSPSVFRISFNDLCTLLPWSLEQAR